jgi:hypothetical protein
MAERVLEKERIHFHEKTSVGGDESLSCPIDLKLILSPLLFFVKLPQNTDSLLPRLYFKQTEEAAIICRLSTSPLSLLNLAL